MAAPNRESTSSRLWLVSYALPVRNQRGQTVKRKEQAQCLAGNATEAFLWLINQKPLALEYLDDLHVESYRPMAVKS